MKTQATNLSTMRSKLSSTYLIFILTLLYFGCSESGQGQNTPKLPASALSLHTGDDRYLPVNKKESKVAWKGGSLNGLNNHNGWVSLSNGELMMEGGQLKGGTVEVDMNSIEDKNGKDNKLVKHLKDADFFEVDKFPFSTIVITRVAPAVNGNQTITGNLTIKGITHPVIFPAKIEVKDGAVLANAKLVIDRAKWNVRYKSRKFYDLVANQTISDSIEFQLKIVAKRVPKS